MKRKICSMMAGLMVLAAGMMTAQDASSLQSRTQDIMGRLEQSFPALATDDALKHEYEQQLRLQLLKGCSYQDAYAQIRQELSFQFDGSDRNGMAQFRRREALKNLKKFRTEQDILLGPARGENLNVNIYGQYSDQKSETAHR